MLLNDAMECCLKLAELFEPGPYAVSYQWRSGTKRQYILVDAKRRWLYCLWLTPGCSFENVQRAFRLCYGNKEALSSEMNWHTLDWQVMSLQELYKYNLAVRLEGEK